MKTQKNIQMRDSYVLRLGITNALRKFGQKSLANLSMMVAASFLSYSSAWKRDMQVVQANSFEECKMVRSLPMLKNCLWKCQK